MAKRLLSVLLFLVIACRDNESFQQPLRYPNILELLEREGERLQKQNYLVKRRVIWNGAKEIRSLNVRDWKKELEIFKILDLNSRPSFLHAYDSLKRGDGVRVYSLKSGEKSQLRHIEVGDSIIRGVRVVNSLVYSDSSIYEIRLNNKQLEGYHIETFEKVFLFKSDHMVIDMDLIP